MAGRRPPRDEGPSAFEEAMRDVRRDPGHNRVLPRPPRPAARPHPRDEGVEFAIETAGESVRARAAGIDRRHLRRMARGEIDYDRRIDLHGYGAEEARRHLTDTLVRAFGSGERCVLVIHGRGLHSEDAPILKTALIEWLTSPPLAPHIMAFSTAPARDGGPGATAVLLRRAR